jgi:hypothetical protein
VTTTRDDDWLEQALRAQGAEHRSSYINDDGFSSRVLAALPAPATLPAWRTPALVMLWLVAGIAVALMIPGWFESMFRGAVAIFVGHRVSLAELGAGLLVMGALTWGALLYAARSD